MASVSLCSDPASATTGRPLSDTRMRGEIQRPEIGRARPTTVRGQDRRRAVLVAGRRLIPLSDGIYRHGDMPDSRATSHATTSALLAGHRPDHG